MKKVLLIFIFCAFFLGCGSYHIGRFSYITTKNIDQSANSERIDREVRGKDRLHMILSIVGKASGHWFIFPFAVGFPRIDNAVDEALKKSNGDFMTDTDINYGFFILPPFYFQAWYEVKGEVWKTK
jgi:hypothetical protein